MEPYQGRRLEVTTQMRKILNKSRPISVNAGGQKLRELYRRESLNFSPPELSLFGQAVYFGVLDKVMSMVSSGESPPLDGTETAFKMGYATLIVHAAQRVYAGPPGSLKHAGVLSYLLSQGLPPDLEDVVGFSALHHLASCPGKERDDLARILLEYGANVNHQNIYGETPIFCTFQMNFVKLLDVFLEFGADLDVKEADGITPRENYINGGPQVSAVVRKWIRKRSGEEALREEKKCNGCGKTDGQLKLCMKCRVVNYCSKECQRSDWREHKKQCKTFDEESTITLKPFYVGEHSSSFSPADIVRSRMGIPVTPTSENRHRISHVPNLPQPKSIIIKAQSPVSIVNHGPSPSTDARDILVYTKKRDFACHIRREDNLTGYDRLSEVIKTQGAGGLKAYFAAELRSKDELIVKVGEVLADQPF